MSAESMRRMTFVVALLVGACAVSQAHAQCCGGGGGSYYSSYAPSYSVGYAPSYSVGYSPTYYQSYYSGWYPGYYMDRIRARLWGSSTTYVAAYPATYTASYAPSYTVGYPSYSVGYAAPACSSCGTGGCSSCATTVSYAAPACSSCSSCSACSSCSGGVVQASYQEPGCSNCGTGLSIQEAPVAQPQAPPANTPAPTPAPGQYPPAQQTYGPETPQPTLNNSTTTERPVETPAVPSPGDDTTGEGAGEDAQNVEGENSTFFQAPQLFDPNDRTAARIKAPVTRAVYERPGAYRTISQSRGQITRAQAEADASGWTSSSR